MFDLVEMQRERELLLTEAQRLVRIQPEIAHGFHRQVETNLIVRSCYRGPTNWLIAPRVRTAILGENFSDNFAGEHICPCDCTSQSEIM
jgi:hypothetical protein